jgi:hypothetical protein
MPATDKTYPKDLSGNLFDYLKRKFGLKTDSALAAHIGMWTNDVSRIRNGKRAVTNYSKLKIHVATKVPLKQINRLIAKEEE